MPRETPTGWKRLREAEAFRIRGQDTSGVSLSLLCKSQNAGKSAVLALTVHGQPPCVPGDVHAIILMWSVGSRSALDAVERSGAVCKGAWEAGRQAAAVTPVTGALVRRGCSSSHGQ